MHLRNIGRARPTIGAALFLAAVLVATSAGPGNAGTRRLNASTLPVGGTLAVHSSPLNQGAAMEMDTFDWLSAAVTYRLEIQSNATGRPLNLRWMGVNGSIITSCTAPAGGGCVTPAFPAAGNLLFQGLVATGNGSPVNANAHYTFIVRRTA